MTSAAVTRRPAEFPIAHDRLTVLEADVCDAPAVDRAVEGADVVLSALGVPFTRNQDAAGPSRGDQLGGLGDHRVAGQPVPRPTERRSRAPGDRF